MASASSSGNKERRSGVFSLANLFAVAVNMVEDQMVPAGKDHDVALLQHAKALARHRARRSVARDRFVAFGRPRIEIDPRRTGLELVALVMEQGDVPEQVEKMRLRLIDSGIPRD